MVMGPYFPILNATRNAHVSVIAVFLLGNYLANRRLYYINIEYCYLAGTLTARLTACLANPLAAFQVVVP